MLHHQNNAAARENYHIVVQVKCAAKIAGTSPIVYSNQISSIPSWAEAWRQTPGYFLGANL